MIKVLNFLDTSAVLNGGLKLFENVYISPLVLTELEHIKNSINKSDKIKYLAREAVRDIITSTNISYSTISQKQINKNLKRYDFLSDINDHRLLCEALVLSEEQEVKFITSDSALLLFAQQFPQLKILYLEEDVEPSLEEYSGWKKCYPTEEQLNSLYSNPEMNVLQANINEYCEIFEGSELKDILRWTGKKYVSLKWSDFKNNFLNKKIQPYNLEQKMAFDLLQNQDITVKILTGAPGTGKDYLMLLHALDLIQKGFMEKIIFVRNLVPFKDAPEIGFLAGDLQQKISWGLGPVASILGEEGLLQYEEQGIIEAVNLGFIRGCSWDNTIIYVSEGQNITGGGYKLLVSRCGKNSQLWVNGDILQTDAKNFEKNNGLFRLSNSLKNNVLAGTVKLLKTERSKTAELAAII